MGTLESVWEFSLKRRLTLESLQDSSFRRLPGVTEGSLLKGGLVSSCTWGCEQEQREPSDLFEMPC